VAHNKARDKHTVQTTVYLYIYKSYHYSSNTVYTRSKCKTVRCGTGCCKGVNPQAGLAVCTSKQACAWGDAPP